MLTFTPDGRFLLVANEGEPSDDYLVDPEGSVSIVDLGAGLPGTVRAAGFSAFAGTLLSPAARVFGPRASFAQDLEPEYITVSDDGRRAWVTLQDNNAIAEIDVERGATVAIRGLGFKDHLLVGNGLDASDRDGPSTNSLTWPVHGLYQPDGIASYRVGGQSYPITANEGDARDYDGFSEEARVGALRLDPGAFPNAAALQSSAQLGRLTVTTANGDPDGDFDELSSFGARSFSIWNAGIDLVFDSGDRLERITSVPGQFNSDHASNNSFDTRSDNKGPEPEGVEIGIIGERT